MGGPSHLIPCYLPLSPAVTPRQSLGSGHTHTPSRAGSLWTESLLSGVSHPHLPLDPPTSHFASPLPGGLSPLAPHKATHAFSGLSGTSPGLEGRACLASSPRNQMLDQFHWQNCDCSLGVLSISANSHSSSPLCRPKPWSHP